MAVYSKRSKGRPFKESDVPKPSDEYGRSKLAGEKAVRYGEVPYTLLRIGMVYGPGFDEAYIPLLKMLNSRGMPYIGPANNHLPFVHVDDIVRAFLLASKKDVAVGETYNLVGERITQKKAFDLACEYLGVHSPRLHASPGFLKFAVKVMNIFVKLRGKKPKLIPEHIDMLVADRAVETDKTQMELGWEPQIDIKEGIRQMVEYYRERKG